MTLKVRKMLGYDFGLHDEWLLEVPRLLELNGVPAKKQLSKKLTLPPVFSDETIYKLDLEWSKPPVPFASDIYHYFALRYFRQDDD